MKKKLLSVLLATGLCLGVASSALACDELPGGIKEDCFSCSCSHSSEYGNHHYELVKQQFGDYYLWGYQCVDCGHTR